MKFLKKNENDINFFLYINNVSNECVSSPVDNCVTVINGSNVKSVSELSRIGFEGSEDQPMMENGNNNSDNVHDVEQINLENHYAGSVDRSFVDDNSNDDNDVECVSDDDKVHGVERIRRNKKKLLKRNRLKEMLIHKKKSFKKNRSALFFSISAISKDSHLSSVTVPDFEKAGWKGPVKSLFIPDGWSVTLYSD